MAKKKKKKKQYTHIPERFFERLDEMFGRSLSLKIQDTFIERPTTFRINTLKPQDQNVVRLLQQDKIMVEKVAWCSDAYILKNSSKRELTKLDIYEKGGIYIQSLASMVPPLVLDPRPGEKILDLTAAPGSKTSQIAAMMGRQGELVANDKNKVRFFKLKHNMEGLGVVDNFSPYQGEPEGVDRKTKDGFAKRPHPTSPDRGGDWLFSLRMEPGHVLCQEYPEYFDKILLDAPCSSETRFVSTLPRTFMFWKERKIKEMAYAQRKLLLAAWGALKPGGTLVYSTCTFAPEENEMQISRLLERAPDAKVEKVRIDGLKALPTVKEWKGKEVHKDVQKCLRILPTKSVQGFFVAKIKKSI